MTKCKICGDESNYTLPQLGVVIFNSDDEVEHIEKEYMNICKFHLQYFTTQERNNYKWIEELMETPYRDGRQRITDLVLVPYLANVKELSRSKTMEKVKKWFNLCNYSKIDRNYLRRQYNYVKRRGLNPLSKEKFENKNLHKYRARKNVA